MYLTVLVQSNSFVFCTSTVVYRQLMIYNNGHSKKYTKANLSKKHGGSIWSNCLKSEKKQGYFARCEQRKHLDLSVAVLSCVTCVVYYKQWDGTTNTTHTSLFSVELLFDFNNFQLLIHSFVPSFVVNIASSTYG